MPHDADPKSSPAGEPKRSPAGSSWRATLQASAARRALLLTALGGLLIAGVVTALPVDGKLPGLVGYLGHDPAASTITNAAFGAAARGDCLTWPAQQMAAATVVPCAEQHRFEVAEAVDLSIFPGSEYGPKAEPPSDARIEQITTEQCEPAVRRYLGPRFDPHSRFVPSMLWSGDTAWRQAGERRMLCGLQLPGANGDQTVFGGKVADLDQSRVWPAGTCLGIDPATNQTTDIPTDCAGPHAMEVTGTVNLAEKFPDALPPIPEQDAFIKDACTRLTEGYLAPVQLRSTTLTLIYNAISLPSWSAGSHEVACSIGATLGNGGWAALMNSARGALLINGLPPTPPPDIPEERMNLPPIPMQVPQPPSSTGGNTQPRPSNQHGPQPQPAPPVYQPAPQAPAPQAPAPQAPAPQAPPPQEPPPDGPAPDEPPPGI